MNKSTKFFSTVGLAIGMAGQGPTAAITAETASAAGVKYLRGNGESPEWAEIPTARDLFAQYEPTTRRLTASLHDVALHRYVTQRLT